MSEDFIKEAKNFRKQMKWCSIICWVATAIFIYNYYSKPSLQNDLTCPGCGNVVIINVPLITM